MISTYTRKDSLPCIFVLPSKVLPCIFVLTSIFLPCIFVFFVIYKIFGRKKMERDLSFELKKWVKDTKRKPLILRGARQVHISVSG